jgi:hypothetical protein
VGGLGGDLVGVGREIRRGFWCIKLKENPRCR